MKHFLLSSRSTLPWALLFFLFVSVATFAQNTPSISGKITSETGEPLPGVSVLVRGTSKGTTADNNGVYQLSGTNKNTVLVFSYIGYLSQEVAINNRKILDIQLAVDEKSLSEVVVVGYGTQKKINLTGAVSTIDSKAIENRPSSNLATALQGVAPGLTIQRQSGQPGNEGISLQIRGATTANGNVDPLVIVDGVTSPTNTLLTINPNDIENISVLKDAAAASIYGAAAAGGVVLITTKKGHNGKVKFDYLGQIGQDKYINAPERMTLLEEAEFANLARKNSGTGPEYSDFDLENIRNGVPYIINPTDTTAYRWYNQESLIGTLLKPNATMHTHNLSARGGNDKLNFLVSGGYYFKDGVFRIGPDDVKRYNFRTNLNISLTKHISLDSRVGYTLEKVAQASAGAGGEGLIYQIYRLRSRTPFFTPEGRFNGAGSAATAYATLEAGGYNNFTRNNLDGVFTLKAANFVKGLVLTAVYGVQNRRGDRALFQRTVPLWERTRIASYLNQVNAYTLTKDQLLNTNLQFLANYNTKLGKKHNIGLLAGYQWEDYRFDQLTTAANNLVSNDLPTLNLGNDLTKSNSQNIQTFASQSVFGRFNYNYDNKYLLEATIRADESSKLAPGLRNKIFPSVSAGWNIHQEPFMKNLTFLSEFKLRASYGTLGGSLGSGLGNYDYLNVMARGSSLVLGDSRTSYLFQSSIPSTSLSWETIETSNVGVNLGLFRNRLQISGDYYVKFNRNMLTPLQLPATMGVGTPRINNGELKSWGWETEAEYRDRIGKSFGFSISANLSDNQNQLISYSGRRVVAAGTNGLLEGYSLSSIFGFSTDGYFQTADEVKAWAFQDSRTGAGDVRYKDLNGDGRITVGKGNTEDPGDLTYMGNTQPRYLFGSRINMDWKGFDFSMFWQGVGKRTFQPNAQSIAPLLVTWKQALAIHRDYWTPENPNATYPRPYVGGTHNYHVSDKWLMNGQYIRLKNLQFGYSLPNRVISRLNLTRARVFFSGQDMLTFSKLGVWQNYYDPETRNGVENDYPYFSSATVGLNLSF